MICQDCGEEMIESARFCIRCGYPVLERASPATKEREEYLIKVTPHGKAVSHEDRG